MKKTLNLLITVFVFMATTLFAEDPILVRLATATQRLPIYLTHLSTQDSTISSSYCTQLEKILQFDLDHNGMTSLNNCLSFVGNRNFSLPNRNSCSYSR